MDVCSCQICGAMFRWDPYRNVYSTERRSSLYCSTCQDELNRRADNPSEAEKAEQARRRAAYFK